MPWTGHTFQQRHNHSLSPGQSDHAARIANAILRRGEPEGIAIATANKMVHRDDGGGLGMPSDPNSIGGIAPNAQNQNPLIQGQIQRYASLPTEKLQELAARLGGTQQGQLLQRLLVQRHTQPQTDPARQMPQQQSPVQQGNPGSLAPPPLQLPNTAPTGYKRGGEIKRDMGGDMGVSPSMGSPWWTRREASDTSGGGGFLHGITPGRADAVKTQAPAGSYVFPADVIAGLGEGNSLSGARIMQSVLDTGPHGIPMPRGGGGGRGLPRPPAPYREQASGGKVPDIFPERKAGGVKNGQTPVALSHGEFVATPKHAMMWGRGDIKRGHRIFDSWVKMMREEQIKKLKKLPPPVGSK
jgi:hypothetical protein